MNNKKSFAGYSRRHTGRLSVRLVEIAARAIITVGGVGTIVAVILVGIFLVYVAVPLFGSATVAPPSKVALTARSEPLLRAAVDDDQLLGWWLYADGILVVARLDTGTVLEQRQLFPGQKLTACSSPSREDEMVFGFADGKVRVGHIGFVRRFIAGQFVPENLRQLPLGKSAEFESGTLTRAPNGKFHTRFCRADIDEPLHFDNNSPVALLDESVRPNGFVLTVLTADGTLWTRSVTRKRNEVLDTVSLKITDGGMSLPLGAERKLPAYLLLSGVGDNVFAAWDDGRALRINVKKISAPKVVEEFNLVGRDCVALTALQFMIGKTTLLAGDSEGRVRAWFRKEGNDSAGPLMATAHEIAATGSPVTSLAVSSRTRIAAAGDKAGRVRLFNVTSLKSLGETHTPDGEPIADLVLAPKDDGLIARTADSVSLCKFNPEHPEITLSSLIFPVWYEGYNKPAHVWQTSSGSDEFEPKFGMWPLIFGTLKATCYSLLLGVPLALLAAIYTSEFMAPRAKNLIKPTIESMASLPSVVLGFLAALVLAPFVDHWLAAVLAAILTIPGAFVLGAYLWQMLPEKVGLVLSRYRFLFVLTLLPLGLAAAALLGPVLERLLFQGDIKTWVNGAGSATPGWFVLLLPASFLVAVVLLGQIVNPWVRRQVRQLNRFEDALVDFGKFLAAALVTITFAWVVGRLLTAVGLDPRGALVGTYVQRNALVVGFMMGFAIIPIIFTIAEDALSAVPEHLRSASLGCGATPWQTATRIIMPTAMSGLFSAVMIGLGRAVGETMIVLMAAGNAAVLDWNMFNGFRTLSANIAVELPEAVRGSTHFRTLFLSAVVLFAITFTLNTIAEGIRLRFRKRAFQL